MDDVNTIYYNDFGVAFQWKRCALKDFKKIQLVFRNTGLLLNHNDIIQFNNNIKKAIKKHLSASNTCLQNSCDLILIEAPNPQISFALSYNELKGLDDLLKGICFQLGLNKLIDRINLH